MKKAYFTVIYGRKDIDSFMKAADLFNGKNLGTINNVEIDYKENTSLTLKKASKAMPVIKEALENTGQIVSFIHLKMVRNGDDIKINSTVKPIVDLSAREISDGEKAFVFKDFIEKATPFKCETDNCYYIKQII